MTFTYSSTSLSTSLAKVRLEIGDTTASDGVLPGGTNLTDEEINRYLAVDSNIYAAAALICQMLATRWAREATKSLGDYSLNASDISKAYALRAVELSRRAATGGTGVSSGLYAGGISQDRKDTVEDDSDRAIPAFSRELDRISNSANFEREDD